VSTYGGLSGAIKALADTRFPVPIISFRGPMGSESQQPAGRRISIPSDAMPILPAEPDCNPPNLWDDQSLPVDGDVCWWCLHTKPRQEKAIARDLRMQEIVYYLPQVVKEGHTPKGRKIQSVVPLFAGYVFINGDLNDRLNALRGHRLVKVLEVVDQESLTRDLRQIHTMLSSG